MKKQFSVNIDRRGRFTMPREIREHFEMLGGGEVVFVIKGDSVTIELPPLKTAESMTSGPTENGPAKTIDERYPA